MEDRAKDASMLASKRVPTSNNLSKTFATGNDRLWLHEQGSLTGTLLKKYFARDNNAMLYVAP